VIAHQGVVGFDLMVPVQVFRRVSRERYSVQVVAPDAGPVFDGYGIEIRVSARLDAMAQAETIIIPGVDDVAIAPDPAVVEAIRAAHQRGARIASICTGAFLLAHTGLLDYKSATTHWAVADELAKRYPKVKVDPKVLYIDHGNVITAAGATAGIDLCLHLVRRDFGERVANSVARTLVASPHRSGGQSQFIPRTLPPSRTRHLGPLCSWAIEHIEEPHSIASLAERAGLTPRSLARRFQLEIGSSPLQWLLEQRVRKAQALLESTTFSVERIAQECGFNGVLACRRHFRKLVGANPQDYRRLFTAAPDAPASASARPQAFMPQPAQARH
jgi:transcriptional regulator GlxA family with amidase domain